MRRQKVTRSRLTKLLLAGTTAVFLIMPAKAQLLGGGIVFDPTNYTQNVLTAVRALQQVNNEILMLQNQAVSLVNEARNLTSLPYSSLAALNSSISATRSLLTSAREIAYDVGEIDRAFTRTYPTTYSGVTSSAQLLTDARTRWQNALAGFQDAMRVQAGVVENLDSTKTEIDSLVGASQSATGALQAAQSGNQLVALQTKQLADLTAVMAAMARAQSLEGARQVANQEQANAQRERFLDYGTRYVPGTAEMFH